jgi:hypothetical protein
MAVPPGAGYSYFTAAGFVASMVRAVVPRVSVIVVIEPFTWVVIALPFVSVMLPVAEGVNTIPPGEVTVNGPVAPDAFSRKPELSFALAVRVSTPPGHSLSSGVVTI